MEKEYKYISIYEIEARPRTKAFEISLNQDGTILGNISWNNDWRQYVFEPVVVYSTIWSEDCLKDIYDFLVFLKEEKRQKKLADREEQKNEVENNAKI